jgi:hypothetical protein
MPDDGRGMTETTCGCGPVILGHPSDNRALHACCPECEQHFAFGLLEDDDTGEYEMGWTKVPATFRISDYKILGVES